MTFCISFLWQFLRDQERVSIEKRVFMLLSYYSPFIIPSRCIHRVGDRDIPGLSRPEQLYQEGAVSFSCP